MALRISCNTQISTSPQVKVDSRSKKCLQNVKSIVNNLRLPSISSSPLEALKRGNWVKLICGASFEDVVDIRNLSLVYTLAGVDCIDCAADASVVNAVNEGIEIARDIINFRKPWLMISVNDDNDLHFRKAEFDPEDCPADCSRPCVNVCPANAISFQGNTALGSYYETQILRDGVITERCYGCGRCFPVCPYNKISGIFLFIYDFELNFINNSFQVFLLIIAMILVNIFTLSICHIDPGEVTYIRDAITTADLMKRDDVDAIEIHTTGRQTATFRELWTALGDSVKYMRLIAVSLPNGGDLTTSTMNEIFSTMKPNLQSLNLWQLDGRPMSGDIGRGATKETIAFAVQMANARDRPPGFLQLAGGTNAHTIDGLKKEGLFQTTIENSDNTTSRTGSADSSHALIGGIAYGGYARKIVGRALRAMQSQYGIAACIEDHPHHLLLALKEALALVGPFKCQ